MSDSRIPPKFKESLLRVPFNHKAQIQYVIGILQGVVLGTTLEAASFPDNFCHACALHFVATQARTNILYNLLGPLQATPNRGLKRCCGGETLKRNNVRQIWFLNQSIELEAVQLL